MVAKEYLRRLGERQAALLASGAEFNRFGNLRLLIVIAGIAFAYWRIWWGVASAVAAFAALGIRLNSLGNARQRLEKAVAYYEQALERLKGNWVGAGSPGDRFLPPEHLYAKDLDLFGRGGVFELLCRARTRMGERTLAAWLLAPAPVESVLTRQHAVQELGPNIDLREDLAILGGPQKEQVRTVALAEWGEAESVMGSRLPYSLLWIVSALGALAGLLAMADIAGAGFEIPLARVYYLSMALICGTVLWRNRAQTKHVLSGAEGAVHEVALLAEVLARLEAERFTSKRLVDLRAELDVEGLPPSRRIAQLRRLMDLVDSRDHVILRVFGPFVLWDLHLAYALENWRAQSGMAVRRWVDAVGELEALTSLAGFHYENPRDIFPALVSDGLRFEATALAHPLMHPGQAVANDVRLGSAVQALVVSGSNMSGKSTLMRTIGVNAVLAQAGAPVRAASLTLGSLFVGASIQTHDSLQANTSRFYAEILRLRDIMQKAREGPVLFLIDEVLSGTNSHDRSIGAAAILQGLIERGAIGLVSTHDLALTGIAGEHGTNVHFEDQLVDGTMRFDYKMKPGVVTHSNAIALMRAVGLEV